MSRPDFEAMMSDENTTYESPDGEKDLGVEVVFGEDGEAEVSEISNDEGPSVDELRDFKPPSEKTKDRIGRLTFEREEAKRLAAAKQAENDELRRQNATLMNERQTFTNNNIQMADTMRESMKASREKELEAAKGALKKAFDDGDGDAMATAQADIARVQTELSHINLAEQNAKQFKQERTTQQQPQYQQQPQQTQQQPQAYTNPQQAMSPKTVAWIDENQHWFGQPGYEGETSYAYGMHERLVRKGLQAGSDEYWSEANQTLKKAFPHLDNGKNFGAQVGMNGSQGGNTNTNSRPNVAAPSSRTANKDPRKKKVTLTSSQVAIATKLGITPQQYAAQTLKKNYDGIN